MPSDKRLLRLLIVLAVVATPAAAMRVACVGHACDETESAPTIPVPFCSLPGDVRDLVVGGYRNERSPEVLAITQAPAITGQIPKIGPTGAALTWPSLASPADTQVPIAIAGPGIPHRSLDLRLDAVAPTADTSIGVEWPFPTYRTGEPVPGTHRTGAPLIVFIAWKGVGASEVGRTISDAPQVLQTLLHDGSGSLTSSTGSLPIDATASLTTAGAGAPPKVHGITGTLLRNDAHAVVEAWSRSAPYAVINALGDGLDTTTKGASRVGLVATEPFDRGLIGGTWFQGVDPTWSNDDDVLIRRPRAIAKTAVDLIADGYGVDAAPDLLGVTLEGSVRQMDTAARLIIAAADEATGDRAIVAVFGTGTAAAPTEPLPLTADDVATHVADVTGTDAVEALVPGGLFLDRDAMATAVMTSGDIVSTTKNLRLPEAGGASPAPQPRVMADVFPAFAITLARFC